MKKTDRGGIPMDFKEDYRESPMKRPTRKKRRTRAKPCLRKRKKSINLEADVSKTHGPSGTRIQPGYRAL